MSIFTPLEAELSNLWSTISGEARAAIESALSDAKAEISVLEATAADIEAKVRTAASLAASEVRAAVAADLPEVKGAAEAALAKLLAAIESALGA